VSAAAQLVSVIIVNYNGRHHLGQCLAALKRQTLPRNQWEVILVDNGSRDGSVELVRRDFPEVHVISLARNTGFAAGNNIGFKRARGRLIALLNNDTAAEPRWLEEMAAAAEAHPRAGGVAAKIVFHHDPSLLQSAGLVLFRDGRGGDRGFRELDRGQYEHCDEVFGACGAGMLLRLDLIEDVGFFDERLFMYYEDLDLAWRARRRGWSFVYAPRAVVRHVHCGSSNEGSPFFCYYVERNRVLVNLKNNSLPAALWTLGGSFARAVRAWYRIIRFRNTGPTRLAHGWAHLRAVGSILTLLPIVLVERIHSRAAQRAVPESRLERLVAEPPAKAA